MFDRLSNNDISKALSELITCLGVKEDTPLDQLATLLRKKDTEACVQEIAARLGLPIRINLTYVPKDFRTGTTDGFRSSALARTDWTGHGIEGITAQVYIPQNLPMFGTTGLQDYPIQVRVSENCRAHPAAFVAVMAHELSHVLLSSLWHPQKDSELHTDLVPILLGFRDVVRRGRRTIEVATSGDLTRTRTSTYGYLTDSQFDFACRHVTDILSSHQRDKRRLVQLAEQVQRKLEKTERSLATFRDYFEYLDRKPPGKMKKEHAHRVVRLHAQDYRREWESRITALRISLVSAESFVRHLSHYTSGAVDLLQSHIRSLDLASHALSQLTEGITKDVRIMRRYVGCIYRFRRILRRVAWLTLV